jgi:hypothetical protein
MVITNFAPHLLPDVCGCPLRRKGKGYMGLLDLWTLMQVKRLFILCVNTVL